MGATERFVRTLPFIIGIQKAIADKKLRNVPYNEFTPQEVERAITILKLPVVVVSPAS